MNDPEADAIFTAEKMRDPSGDGQEYAYVAEAARPDAVSKQKVFRRLSAQRRTP